MVADMMQPVVAVEAAYLPVQHRYHQHHPVIQSQWAQEALAGQPLHPLESLVIAAQVLD